MIPIPRTVRMNGKGRAIDDVFIERLWRSLKYEEVYLHDYSSGREANVASRKTFQFCDHKGPHSALDGETLATVSLGHDWSLPKLLIKYSNSTPPIQKRQPYPRAVYVLRSGSTTVSGGPSASMSILFETQKTGAIC